MNRVFLNSDTDDALPVADDDTTSKAPRFDKATDITLGLSIAALVVVIVLLVSYGVRAKNEYMGGAKDVKQAIGAVCSRKLLVMFIVAGVLLTFATCMSASISDPAINVDDMTVENEDDIRAKRRAATGLNAASMVLLVVYVIVCFGSLTGQCKAKVKVTDTLIDPSTVKPATDVTGV